MAEALAQISRVDGGVGMVTIRADQGACGAVIAAAAGVALPTQGRITHEGGRSLGWMSPDELLLTLPADELPAVLSALEVALAGQHALVVDVSDMRAVFDITGPKAAQVLAKLSPTDFATLPPDALRRSRAAQAAVAFWRCGAGFRLVGFRSVADYLTTILTNAALPGSDLDAR